MDLVEQTRLNVAYPKPDIHIKLKYSVFWDVTPLDFVRNGILQERIAFIIRVQRISELGTSADSFHLDAGGFAFFRNVCPYKNHTASHPRRHCL
jgi:hypothetical protein